MCRIANSCDIRAQEQGNGIPERNSCGKTAGDRGYFAYSTARVSRMTVTLIWPG
jgi:hypothetical protein